MDSKIMKEKQMNLIKTWFYMTLLLSNSAFAIKYHCSPLDKKLHVEIRRKFKNYTTDLNYSKIEEYIQEDANVNSFNHDYYKETPLHYAVQLGDIKLIQLLLDHGADVNARNGTFDGGATNHSSRGPGERTPLFYAFDNNVGYDQKTAYQIVALLLQYNARVDSIDQSKQTPLHLAAEAGNPELVSLLIKHKALLHQKNYKGQTALFNAVRSGNTKVVCLLIKHGVDPLCIDNEKQTLLHEAATIDARMIHHVISYKISVNARNNDGATALFIAITSSSQCKKECVEALLQLNCDIELGDYEKNTPLMRACYNAEREIVEILLKHKAQVNTRNLHGLTPLHLAAGNVEIVRLLINQGADVKVESNFGTTPFHMCHDKETAALFLQHGADINALDAKGETLLFNAIRLALKYRKSFTQFLIENGAAINIKNREGETPLSLALKGYDVKEIKCLLNNRADIECCKDYALQKAAELEFDTSSDLIQQLLDHGVPVNHQSKDTGQTALHVAIENGNIGNAKFLLAAGANVTCKDNNGNTPFDLATNESVKEWIRTL